MVVWTKEAEGQLTKDFHIIQGKGIMKWCFFQGDIMEKLRQIYNVKDFSGKNFNIKC